MNNFIESISAAAETLNHALNDTSQNNDSDDVESDGQNLSPSSRKEKRSKTSSKKSQRRRSQSAKQVGDDSKI